MSYRIELHEALPGGLRRVAAEQVQSAIDHLEGGGDTHEAVHEARKACKKVRALLRLVRDAVGKSRYREENTHYRDAARRISGLRDREAMLETLDKVADDLPLPADRLEALRMALVARRNEALSRMRADGEIESVARALREGLPRIADWPLPEEDDQPGFRHFAPGLGRVYRRGRHCLAQARRSGDTATLHELRKRTKYLRHQLELLSAGCPEMLSAHEQLAHSLTDALGFDHDLAVFVDATRDETLLPSQSVTGEQVRGFLAEQRRLYQRRLWPIAERVYAERPRAFVERVSAYRATLATHLV